MSGAEAIVWAAVIAAITTLCGAAGKAIHVLFIQPAQADNKVLVSAVTTGAESTAKMAGAVQESSAEMKAVWGAVDAMSESLDDLRHSQAETIAVVVETNRHVGLLTAALSSLADRSGWAGEFPRASPASSPVLPARRTVKPSAGRRRPARSPGSRPKPTSSTG